MGFINSRVASVISLGGVCSGLVSCGQVGAMEGSFKVSESLLGNLENLLSNNGKSNLNIMLKVLSEDGCAKFERIIDILSQNDELEVLAGLLDKLDENGSLVFSKMINRVDDDGAGKLYLMLSKVSVADKSDVKKPYVVKFAGFLKSLDDVCVSSFSSVLGKKEFNNFGVNNLFHVVLKELDEQGLRNIAGLLNKIQNEFVAEDFVWILNDLSSSGVSNFSKVIESLTDMGILNFVNALADSEFNVEELVKRFNRKDFGADAFVDKLINGGKNLNVEKFLSELGLGGAIIGECV